jgi:hypothetical protein
MIGFDRRSALGLTATLELRVRVMRDRRGMPFTLRFDDGELHVRPGAPPDPAVTASIHVSDVVRLWLGTARWPQLLSSGRLQLTGDPFLALRVPTLFRLRAGR